MAAISIETILERYEELSQATAQRNINMLAWRDLYFLREQAYFQDDRGQYREPIEDEVRVILPAAFITVEALRQLLITKPPSISVPPSSHRAIEKEQAEIIEKQLLSVYAQGSVYHELCMATWHALVDGMGCMFTAYDTQADENECPIVVRDVDPYYLYAMPGRKPRTWQYVINAYPRMVGEVYEEWVSGKDNRRGITKDAREALEGMKMTDEVMFIDYWDKTHNAVAIKPMVDRRGMKSISGAKWLKKPMEHKYGFLPWTIFFWHELPFKSNFEDMSVGALYSVQETLKYFVSLASQKATTLARYADSPLIIKSSAGADATVDRQAGSIIGLFQDEDARYLEHSGSSPEVDVMLSLVKDYLEMGTLPSHLMGQYIGQVSGIALSLLRNPTLMKIAFFQESLESALEQVNEHILRLVEKFVTSPVYLWGKDLNGQPIEAALDGGTIKGYYRNSVKLSASLPADEPGIVAMLANMVQMDILSRQTARDVAQQMLSGLVGQSISDETMNILAEKIMDDPALLQNMAMMAAQEAGIPIVPQLPTPQQPGGNEMANMPPGVLASQSNPTMPTQADASAAERLKTLMRQRQGQQGGRPMEPPSRGTIATGESVEALPVMGV